MEVGVLLVPLLGRVESTNSPYPIRHPSLHGRALGPLGSWPRMYLCTCTCVRFMALHDTCRVSQVWQSSWTLNWNYQHNQKASRKCPSACKAILRLPGLYNVLESPAQPWWSWNSPSAQSGQVSCVSPGPAAHKELLSVWKSIASAKQIIR